MKKENTKKVLLIGGLIVTGLLVIAVVIFLIIFMNKEKDAEKKADEEKQLIASNLKIVAKDNGIPKYIGGAFSDVKVTDEETALKALEDIKDLMSIKNVNSEFYLKEKNVFDNATYFEMQQKVSGIDVLGEKLTISVDKDGNIKGLNGSYTPNVSVKNYGLISEDQAKQVIINQYGANTEIVSVEKYVYTDSKNYVVYLIDFACETGIYEAVINAEDSRIVTVDSLVDDYSYTGEGLDGKSYTIELQEEEVTIKGNVSDTIKEGKHKVYLAKDEDRKIIISNAVLSHGAFGHFLTKGTIPPPVAGILDEDGELLIASGFSFDLLGDNYIIATDIKNDRQYAQTVVTAVKAYEDIYDYYKNVLNRDSYDNKGSTIIAYIGVTDELFSDKEMVNAYWTSISNRMYIGTYNGVSFAKAKDALGHEFTHGVVQYTSKFKMPKASNRVGNIPNFPGALNEAYADIMGNIIFNGNWIVGEELDAELVGRDIANPHHYEKPSAVDDEYYFPNSFYKDSTLEEYLQRKGVKSIYDLDKGGVHHNSTIVSHSAYLMYNNGAFKDMDELAKVWYNSLFLLSSYSDFEDCAYAVIQSAINLGLSDEKVKIIHDAFVETKIIPDEFYKVSGKVTDSDSGKPIFNALVSVVNDKNQDIVYEVYTNKDGEYTLEDVQAGKYTVNFEKAKYNILEKEIELDADEKVDAELELIPESVYKDSEIVFVMDISKSMDESDPEDIRKQIIGNILGSLDSNAKVALVTFTQTAKVVNDGINDKAVDNKVLITDVFNIVNDNGLDTDSGTNGKAGLEKGLSLFSDKKEVRKYIVFLTDGQDTLFATGTSYSKLAEMANEKGVRILSIGLGSDDDLDEDELIKVAEGTNGRYYHATTSSKLYKFDRRLFDELN